MNKEIKIGDYVRTDTGRIIKYEFLEKNDYEIVFGEKGKCFTFEDEEEFEIFINESIKTIQKNIIDLIEIRRLYKWQKNNRINSAKQRRNISMFLYE